MKQSPTERLTFMWQSQVEIEHYSVTYFDSIIAFEVL